MAAKYARNGVEGNVPQELSNNLPHYLQLERANSTRQGNDHIQDRHGLEHKIDVFY